MIQNPGNSENEQINSPIQIHILFFLMFCAKRTPLEKPKDK